MVEILTQEFKQTKIELGKGKGFAVSTKAKYIPPDYSAFCTAGCGWVRIDEQGRCRACKTVIIKQYTFEAISKRFDSFIEHNQHVFDSLTEFQKDNIKIPIKIAHAYYMVPIKYFIEFSNILSHERYEPFFKHIKAVCPIIKF